jgi:hypothetical protein
MFVGIDEGTTNSDPSEMGLDGQVGVKRIPRLVLMASASLLALALGHLVYHYVLFTEQGFWLLCHVGLD